MGLLETAEESIDRFGLIPEGSRVLIAVSGGVDSMVLLDLLQRLSAKRVWSLEIAHFNHQLRAHASDTDQIFVGGRAKALSLPFHVGRADVAAEARAEGISMEMAGRALRQIFLKETALRQRCSIVALAHHADDQVETFWLRLLRGDVGAGLAGMRWKRSVGENVFLVRPLLNIRKAEINEYARDNAVEFREDASNADLKFQRNRIRHEIIPALEAYQPQLRAITLRAAEALAAEKEFLAERARKWLEEKSPDFESVHRALQREVIRLQLLARNIRPTFDLIEELRVSGRSVNLGPNSSVTRLPSGEIQHSAIPNLEFVPAEKELSVQAAGEEAFGGIVVNWEFANARGHREAGVEYFDAARIGSVVSPSALARRGPVSADRRENTRKVAGFIHEPEDSAGGTAKLCGGGKAPGA